MKHRSAEKIQEKTSHMTLEEQLDFWKKRTDVLQRRQQNIWKERHEREALR
jgi:hypothetical protein